MALTLQRRVGESIILTMADGTEVRVKVHKIFQGKVKLQFHTSDEVAIWREELFERVRDADHVADADKTS